MTPRKLAGPGLPSRQQADRDPALVARGYCGRIDRSRSGRCYGEAEHSEPCRFSPVFQLKRRERAPGE